MDDAALGLRRKRRLEVLDGRAVLAARRGDAAEADARRPALRIGGERRPVGRLRPRRIAAQQLEVAGAQQRWHVGRPQRERGGDALGGALEISGAAVDVGLVVGPAELAGLERARLPEAGLGRVQELVAEIEQAQSAERGERLRAPLRDEALGGGPGLGELRRHRRLEDVGHREWNRAQIGCRRGLGGRRRRRRGVAGALRLRHRRLAKEQRQSARSSPRGETARSRGHGGEPAALAWRRRR